MLGLAAALRIYAWSQTAVIFNDGPIFLATAEAICAGQWKAVLAHPYHPFYAICTAALAALGLPLIHAAIAVSVAGGLLAVVSLYVLFGCLFDRRIACIGAVVIALHPWAIDFSSDVMSDGLYMGLYLAALAALARSLDDAGWGSSAACGLFVAMAYLTRPEGIGLALIAALVWGIEAVRKGHNRNADRDGPRTLGKIVVLALAAGVLIGPYVTALSLEHGSLIWTQKKSVTALARGQDVLAVAPHRLSAPLDRPIWLPQPSVTAQPESDSIRPAGIGRLLDAIGLTVRTSLAALRYEVALFVALGCLALWRIAARPRQPVLLWAPVAFYTLILTLLVWGAGYISRRHALAPLAPLIGVAGVGWQMLSGRWLAKLRGADGSKVHEAGTAGVWILIALLAIAWGPRDLRERRVDRLALREAAEWIAQTHPGSGPVAAQKIRSAYYAKSEFVPLPSGLERPLEDSLRGAGTRWIIVSPDRLRDHVGLHEAAETWAPRVYSVRRRGHEAWVLSIK